MATKSKKYKTMRIIAAIVAAVTLFFSGLFACFSIKGAFLYNRYETIGKYTDTDAFRKLMNSVEYTLIQGGEYASCSNEKELAKTSGAVSSQKAVKETEKSIKNACDFLDKAGVEVAVDGYNRYRYMYQSEKGTYYFNYNGDFISRDEYEAVKSGGNGFNGETEISDSGDEDEEFYNETADDAEVFPDEEFAGEDVSESMTTAVYNAESGQQSDVSSALRTIWELTQGLNYGEKSTDALIKEALRFNQPGYNSDDFYDEYALNRVNETSSLKYAIIYKTTGKVYTNCGVKAGDSIEQILKKTGSIYAEIYDSGKYSVKGATAKKVFPIYGSLSLYPAFLSENSPEELVDKAVFAFDADSLDGMFGVGQKAFFGYNQLSAPHRIYTERSLIKFGFFAVLFFVIAAACCLFCIITAGRTNSGELKIRFFDKVPFAVNLAFSGGLVIGFAALVIGSAYYEHDLYELFVYNRFPTGLAMAIAPYISYIQAFLFMLALLIVSGLLASIVRNIKNRTFFKHTLINYIITPVKFVFRKIRKVIHSVLEKLKVIYAKDYAYGKGRKFLILSFAIITGVTVLNFIILFAGGMAHSGLAFVIGIILNLLIIAFLSLLVISFDKLASGVTEIKMGSLTANINTSFMPGFMRSTAEDISTIRQGLSNAVDQAVKDQSMKTELITNVTHDLKTPLTSIITYVDLIKKEGLDGERSGEYLEVIDEKSHKLKSLVDDLVQASKASSGAIDVNLHQLDLCEFALQLAGEYEDELKSNGIDLVVQHPDEGVNVSADPVLLSRVFENLIGNIKKYAMKNTRAFVVVTGNEDSGTIIFKNVSASPMDFDLQRLTDRFYRGDSARTGEGSGLGLSIAKDLCAVQGGVFRIEIDGDMFKAFVSLNKAG